MKFNKDLARLLLREMEADNQYLWNVVYYPRREVLWHLELLVDAGMAKKTMDGDVASYDITFAGSEYLARLDKELFWQDVKGKLKKIIFFWRGL